MLQAHQAHTHTHKHKLHKGRHTHIHTLKQRYMRTHKYTYTHLGIGQHTLMPGMVTFEGPPHTLRSPLSHAIRGPRGTMTSTQ